MKNYPLFKVHIDKDSALDQLGNVFESGYINEGVQVTELNKKFCEILEHNNLICVNSGTSALTLALKLAGVSFGDEVISTAMTCLATNTPIENLGAKLVWADIDPNSGSIDPDDVARKITSRTKAVMCVAWAGNPCDLDKLNKVCKKAGVKLIQDAAHAFGAKWNGESIAKHADFTCYSFQAIKHISCGDGGALVCNDDSKFKLAKKLKWFGLDREESKDEKGNWKGQSWSVDIHEEEVGFKFNMNNVSAAIGLSQLPHLNKILNGHKKNGLLYDKLFINNSVIFPLKRPKESCSSFWVYTVLIKDESINRDELLKKLNNEGIQAGLVHVPNDDYSCWRSQKTDLPGVRYFANRQISLPVGWWLNSNDIEFIAKKVMDLCESI
jgi:perosamine synthetase